MAIANLKGVPILDRQRVGARAEIADGAAGEVEGDAQPEPHARQVHWRGTYVEQPHKLEVVRVAEAHRQFRRRGMRRMIHQLRQD